MLIVGTIFISAVGAADLNNDTATIDDILEETDDTNEISVAGLAEGVYLLRIVDADGIVYTNKITIR